MLLLAVVFLYYLCVFECVFCACLLSAHPTPTAAQIGLGHYNLALPDLRRVCELQLASRIAREKYKEVGALVKKIAFERAIAFEQVRVFGCVGRVF